MEAHLEKVSLPPERGDVYDGMDSLHDDTRSSDLLL
jgi:hypothetical protein